jgi:hypothetical protein
VEDIDLLKVTIIYYKIFDKLFGILFWNIVYYGYIVFISYLVQLKFTIVRRWTCR